MFSTIETKVLDVFHHLHEHPEISWEEIETTKYIEQLLRNSGCKTTSFKDTTGVIGEFGNFDNDLPVVAIRADMDALWQEVDGTFQANHSCGHDAHMAIVLGMLWKLKQIPNLKEKVALKLIFQPAEEKGTGALKMIEKQVADDIDYLFGIHLRPIQETVMGHATPVIIHGATKTINVEIKGEDAHGARPHLNNNAIEIGTEIVTMLSNINLDPSVSHSVKVTKFHAGGRSSNIIPGSATFSMDLRAQDNNTIKMLENKVIAILESIKDLYNADLEITNKSGIAAAKTDEDAIAIMKRAIVDTLGEDKVDPPLVTPGGDDFHFYTIERPKIKATMLGLGCDLEPGLHHPNMTFNKDALINGANILSQAVLNTYGIK